MPVNSVTMYYTETVFFLGRFEGPKRSLKI